MNNIHSLCYGDDKIYTCLVQNQIVGGGLHGVICSYNVDDDRVAEQRRKKCDDEGKMQQPKQMEMCFFNEDCPVY